MRDSPLAGALAVSLGLHALLLFYSVEQPLRRTEPHAPMVVRLAAQAPVPAPQTAAPAARPPSPPKKAAVRAPATQAEFRLELIERARREMRRPEPARDHAWRGEVLVGVLVAANGRASVSLKESSGHELLDRHGVEAFARAVRSLTVPAALRGREFALELRASYGRED